MVATSLRTHSLTHLLNSKARITLYNLHTYTLPLCLQLQDILRCSVPIFTLGKSLRLLAKLLFELEVGIHLALDIGIE